MKKLIAAFGLVSLGLGAPAYAGWGGNEELEIASYADPAFDGYQIESVAYLVTDPNIKAKRKADDKLAMQFERRGVEAYRWEDLFPPTRQFSMEEVQAVLAEKGIKSTLWIQSVGADQGSEHTGYYHWNMPGKYGGSYSTAGNRKVISAQHTATLVDLAAESAVWMAQTDFYATGWQADWEDAGKEVAVGLLDRLNEDGLISE